jgi:hypothetical protein
MIKQDELDQFLLRAKDEKEGTVTGVSPTNFSIRVVDKQDAEKGKVVRKLSFMQNSDEYEVSDRAKSNILKLSGFTGKLLKELQLQEINDGLNYQLSKRNSYGVTRKDGVLYSLFDTTEFVYHPYDEMIPDVNKLVKVKGNPLTSDFVEFQTSEQTLERSGQLVVGMNAIVSSNSMVKSRFGYGVMRVRCTNGWVDSVYGKDILPAVTNEIVAGMIKTYQDRMGGFVERLNSFTDDAEKFEVLNTEHLEELFTHLSVTPKVKQVLYGCMNRAEGEQSQGTDLLLKSAGVDSIKTLWDVFQVLVWIGNNAPNMRQSLSMGKNIFKWADQLLVSQN